MATLNGEHRPLHRYSRTVEAGGLHWYTQQVGEGPSLLLIHGTGSSAHSWYGLAPLLAEKWSVTMFDLPGHGSTRGRPARGLSLAGMSESIGALLTTLAVRPTLVVGHSAGAAIAARMVLDARLAPQALISLNGALLPFESYQRVVFAPLARVLAAMPFTPSLVSWGARDRGAIKRLIQSTGSQLDNQAIDLYWRLLRQPGHIAGVLQMMSQWNLSQLQRELPQFPVPLLQLTASGDRTVPPSEARRVCAQVSRASIVALPGLGHLAHEERPDLVACAIAVAADGLHA